MTDHIPSNEELMAYADGELSEERRGKIAAVIAADATLAKQVEAFSATRFLVKAAAGPADAADVPAALREAVLQMTAAQEQPDNVVPFKPLTQRGAWMPQWSTGLAASIALLVAGFSGYFANSAINNRPDSPLLVVGSDVPALAAAALNQTPSGQETVVGAAKVRLIATVRDQQARLCRELEADYVDGETVVAVACRSATGWTVTMAVAAHQADGGFAPASSLDSVEAYLSAIGANEHLSAEQEQAALAALK